MQSGPKAAETDGGWKSYLDSGERFHASSRKRFALTLWPACADDGTALADLLGMPEVINDLELFGAANSPRRGLFSGFDASGSFQSPLRTFGSVSDAEGRPLSSSGAFLDGFSGSLGSFVVPEG